ncbi:inositol monophosphatase family protein [Rhabdaerophilum sp. SD176]|uniref:inositol monophosphatase family protein n=1 Tax=Rhabdaerophilum sp. SD176 TaxID=2983548 RepID=UPI0024DF4C3A|nr:inositol monophosphatase family protein [Rhabdaerophilum sp. SD176]
MTDASYEALDRFAHTLADAAGAAILPWYRAVPAVDDKGSALGFDPVTEADRAAERAIRDLIQAHYPGHGIIGEEYGRLNPDAEHVWVIDPIDGTKSFIAGQPVWGTLIARLHRGQAVFGLNDQPYLRERYWGDGAQALGSREGRTFPLSTRPCADLAQASVWVSSTLARDAPAHAAIERLGRAVRMLVYGGDCFSLPMLAAGHIDIAIGWGGFEIYDIAAHIPIVAGAGGIVTALDGGNPLHADGMIALGDPALLPATLDRLEWPWSA